MFDKYNKQLAKVDKNITKLEPIMQEYYKTKKMYMQKRMQNKEQMSVAPDDAARKKLNNDLVRINKEEENKLKITEKKLADFAAEKAPIISLHIQNRINEVKLKIMKDELAMVGKAMTDKEQLRMKNMIKSNTESLQARMLKMDKLVKDPNAMTITQDKKIQNAETKGTKAETDYNADGRVDPNEKKYKSQQDTKAKKSNLSKISDKAKGTIKSALKLSPNPF